MKVVISYCIVNIDIHAVIMQNSVYQYCILGTLLVKSIIGSECFMFSCHLSFLRPQVRLSVYAYICLLFSFHVRTNTWILYVRSRWLISLAMLSVMTFTVGRRRKPFQRSSWRSFKRNTGLTTRLLLLEENNTLFYSSNLYLISEKYCFLIIMGLIHNKVNSWKPPAPYTYL